MKTFHQNNDPQALLSHLNENYPYGKYMACYEAGFCGSSVQRKLTALGIECLVAMLQIYLKPINLHWAKLMLSIHEGLEKHWPKNMLRPIYIPSPEFEADRNLIRYRKKLVARLKGHKQSIKSTLFILDIPIPERFEKSCWTNTFIKWLIELQLKIVAQRQQ